MEGVVTMTIQVELSAETEARLAAAAQARGVALEKYAGTLLHEVLASPPIGFGKLTMDELHKMLGEIAEGSDKLPHRPSRGRAFTRIERRR
jgi:hypothetical protein